MSATKPRSALEYLGYLGFAKIRLQNASSDMRVVTQIKETDFQAMGEEIRAVIRSNPAVILPSCQAIERLCIEIASVPIKGAWFPDVTACQRQILSALLEQAAQTHMAYCREAVDGVGYAAEAGLTEVAWSWCRQAFSACDHLIGELEYRVTQALSPVGIPAG